MTVTISQSRKGDTCQHEDRPILTLSAPILRGMRVVTDVVRLEDLHRSNTGADDWILIDSDDFAISENEACAP